MDKQLINALFTFATQAKEIDVYKDSWGEDFCKKRYYANLNTFNEYLKTLIKDVDWENLTEDTARSFGMNRFCSPESIKNNGVPKECENLYLFPLLMIDVIPEGIMVTNIFGETFKFERETCDSDHRFGYLSFGIVVKN